MLVLVAAAGVVLVYSITVIVVIVYGIRVVGVIVCGIRVVVIVCDIRVVDVIAGGGMLVITARIGVRPHVHVCCRTVMKLYIHTVIYCPLPQLLPTPQDNSTLTESVSTTTNNNCTSFSCTTNTFSATH